MENFIDKLKQKSSQIEIVEKTNITEKEKIVSENPLVVCCVTMGKELHVGHLFLITIADQINSGLDGSLPVVLVNNNTGPRSAGALVRFSESNRISLEDAAKTMNSGRLDPASVVSAYKNRVEEPNLIGYATEILDTGEFDIFSAVAKDAEKTLGESGYDVDVVSGALLLKESREKIRSINSTWGGSGFLPVVADRRVVLIEKAGNLTATGALLSSTMALAQMRSSDLVVIVDSQPDAADAAFVQSKITRGQLGVQAMGAGVGIGGEIASGTKGEALTIKEVSKRFYNMRPGGNLRKAVIFFTLTNSLYIPKGSNELKDSFYNFDNNDRIISELIKSCDELNTFNQSVISAMERLSFRVSDSSACSEVGAYKFLEFLQAKSSTLLNGEKDRVLSESRKTVLGVRQNYYFNQLKMILKNIEAISSLTEDQFLTIGKMLQFCLERTGI
jgi:hypothetical protein